jgi:hypothetical protein
LDKPLNFDFGLHLEAVFGPQCASQVEFVGREEVDGQPMLVYFFHIPRGACFGVANNGGRQFAAITGRILVDAANLHVLRSEWVGAGFPEKFAVDHFTTTEQWGYATIGGFSYLVPVSSEIVLRMSDGSTERGKRSTRITVISRPRRVSHSAKTNRAAYQRLSEGGRSFPFPPYHKADDRNRPFRPEDYSKVGRIIVKASLSHTLTRKCSLF